MTTTVIHIRDSKPDSVYIGRPGKKAPNAIFGNPVAKGQICSVCRQTHETNGSTLPCYEHYLRNRLQDDADFNQKFYELKGKELACFCVSKDTPTSPEPNQMICHGQVMARYLDGPKIEPLPPVEEDDWEEEGWRLKEPDTGPGRTTTNENPSP